MPFANHERRVAFVTETLTGFGRILGPGKLEVQTDEGAKTVAARNIIVATGSEPRSIPSVPMDGKTVVSNTEMLSLASRPESIGVIGAGAVGVEFASMFHSFGTKVVVIEVLPRVVPVEDEEISDELYKSFTKRGIETLTETRVDGVKVASDGSGVEVSFTRADGTKDTRIVIKLREAVLAFKRRTGERMTYDLLAERTGLAKGTLHNIGAERNYNATLRTIALICKELDVTPGDLLELIDDPPKARRKRTSRK